MKTAVLATLLAVAGVACGGGEGAGGAASPELPEQTSPEAGETETPVEAPTLDLADGEEVVVVAGGFIDPSTSGFAVKGEDFTSPGPTIRVRGGDTVTITFENAHYFEDGTPFPEPHNFAVVEDKDELLSDMEPLWGASAGGYVTAGLEPGERASTTFTPTSAGTFYYVCAYADHIDHGMWGRFVVEG